MTGKRKQTHKDHHQNQPKKFKPSPANKATGQAKQTGNKKAIKTSGARGKSKNAKALAKWKKKKRYVFKTSKKLKGSSPLEKSVKTLNVINENKPQGDNLTKQKDFNKKKKRRKRNKKTKRKDAKSKDISPTTAATTEDQDSGKTLELSSAAPSKILNASVGKKKKRKGKVHVLSVDTKKQHSGGNRKDEVLPRKPEEISANWKALLHKIEKPKPSKYHKKKQVPDRRSSEVWFDDVDPELLKANDITASVAKETGSQSAAAESKGLFVIDGAEEGPTKCVALDCEMVGAGHGGKNNILARVSIVNQYGYCLYDKFVRSREDVTDYRTWVSGVRKKDLENGEDFLTVQKEVADLLKGRILVGHALQNDMKVLFLDHPKRMVRDTYHYEPFREMFKSRRPGLKSLVEKILNVKVQQGEHSSVEDAQAVMKVYMLHRKKWETSLKMKSHKKSTT